jgi:hypothetical protein
MGCDAGEAMRVMAEQSQNEKTNLRDLAEELVSNTSRQSPLPRSA